MTWLVTGGAGYIGAHVVRAMADAGMPVVVLDDLSTGVAERVKGAALTVGSVDDKDLVRETLRSHHVDGVMHLAGKKQVGESVTHPLLYYQENLDGLIVLLECCRDAGVQQFVFSSSAAVYGPSDADLIGEDAPCRPLSPYGETKLLCEWLIHDCCVAWGLRAMSLRYFNVAGSATAALGDRNASNLIPLVFDALCRGEQPKVFGQDYPTVDGTGVRDYVHVADVADAHLAAARALTRGADNAVYNVGRGAGYSVLEVMRMVGKVTGLEVTPQIVQRRAGDTARAVAAVDRIRTELGVVASRDLAEIVESAWASWQFLTR
ncbi:UDP-glucose 4-epimerase GalE [Skermania sp. ID1734]|uniref:UDP-glucose 4-epimerase GalE n=1 Tax=Skermania sp. ID1734 TaxID=2597516 RepID=UPI00117D4B46|nr:UDP-glucose 4-epimerase GalE [Skermania sp. ID1734]TSD99245.1 UDP-glucose 4-epimerase GalE [Skermania sp. ID1734]